MPTALVIEDDDDIRRLLEVVLQQEGFSVTTAANGTDGLAALEREAPELALIDVGLPDMEGYEVVRRARANARGRIVMLSARTQEADVQQGLDAGADAYLTKPFRPQQLRSDLRRILEGTDAG
ncbi:response regulator transcription factor [Brachybacterium squillarum]|uniref:response regulator transcription factor n=1 Tax=Brachybacterium squillarum TaxID=661979 RepID=UPI002221911F|nr:response regulator [Brachybacterium squillarum]MCW1805173.1 response regulator [Brachybacterium squillarum]